MGCCQQQGGLCFGNFNDASILLYRNRKLKRTGKRSAGNIWVMIRIYALVVKPVECLPLKGIYRVEHHHHYLLCKPSNQKVISLSIKNRSEKDMGLFCLHLPNTHQTWKLKGCHSPFQTTLFGIAALKRPLNPDCRLLKTY